MSPGGSKIDPRSIIRAHRATYVDARTGRRRVGDILLMEGLPAAVLVAMLVLSVELTRAMAVGLLTVTGLLSALLFGVMLQVSERAMDWSDSRPEPGPGTSSHAIYLEELAANAGYASLTAIFAAIAYVAASVTKGWPLKVSTAIGVALGLHLVLVLLMVMRRVFALTRERLNRARTGRTTGDPASREPGRHIPGEPTAPDG